MKTKRNDLARPVMGTIFLVYRDIELDHPCEVVVLISRWGGATLPDRQAAGRVPLPADVRRMVSLHLAG